MSDAATDIGGTDTGTGTATATPPITGAQAQNSLDPGFAASAASADPGQGSMSTGSTNPPPPTNEWLADVSGYTDEGINMPDGMELDDKVAEALSGTCKKMGLSQKAFSTIINEVAPVLEAREKAALDEFRTANLEQFRRDPEIGGARARATMDVANKAYMRLCPEPARKLLEQTGLNCHPDLIRMFYQLGKQISADSAPRSGTGQSGDPLARFFNNSKMNS